MDDDEDWPSVVAASSWLPAVAGANTERSARARGAYNKVEACAANNMPSRWWICMLCVGGRGTGRSDPPFPL
jgi:hypothetical protein